METLGLRNTASLIRRNGAVCARLSLLGKVGALSPLNPSPVPPITSDTLALLTQWTAWIPLLGPLTAIPQGPGLYRIGRAARETLDYIGQTGRGTMTLRKRLSMLRLGVAAEEMPYRTPHTAAPALWALRRSTGEELLASVCPLEGLDEQVRRGLEALAQAEHRLQHGCSPTANFGRILAGYAISGPRESGIRGGPSAELSANHLPGLKPVGDWRGGPVDAGWCCHGWSEWVGIDQAHAAKGEGLYRIRAAGEDKLLYIGQGKMDHRLRSHARKVRDEALKQGKIFAAGPLECSWARIDGLPSHHKQELEVDLIGAHIKQTGWIPDAQFLGNAQDTIDRSAFSDEGGGALTMNHDR